MKRIFVLFLALTMVLSLCACGGSGGAGETEAPEAAGLQVGFGKINVTPDFSVGLDGHSNYETRRSEGFLDYIYATCIAVTSGEETILLFTIDNLAFSNSRAEKLRLMVTTETGIPGEKIFVGATHCHSAPALATSDADCNKYYLQLLDYCVDAAKAALADRAPATMLSTTTEIEGMNFIRHYKMNDGTFAGSNFGSYSSGIAGYARETDPRMILVKFDREGDKKDVLLVNWQAHPDYGGDIGETNISADFPGALREKLGKDADMLVAYFTGASGDQNPKSKITEDNHGLETAKLYGEKLAEYAYNALPNLKPVEGTEIKTNRVMFTVDVDHSKDNMMAQAQEVYDVWKSTTKANGDALAKEYGLRGVYEARGIITRFSMSLTQQLEMNSFRIGDLGFITGTYEMFAAPAQHVRSNSPFETTFIITGCSSYIPTTDAYDYGSYEAVSTYYAQGTAEKLAEQYVTMLNEIK